MTATSHGSARGNPGGRLAWAERSAPAIHAAFARY
jgi:hypothetical protein